MRAAPQPRSRRLPPSLTAQQRLAAETELKRARDRAQRQPGAAPAEPAAAKKNAKPKPAKPASDPLTDFLSSRQGKALQREVVRGVFGMLRKKL